MVVVMMLCQLSISIRLYHTKNTSQIFGFGEGILI